jgi:hypothetical protein
MEEQNPYSAPQCSAQTRSLAQDRDASRLRLPWLSLALLLLLLAFAPFVALLPPYAAYKTDSVHLWRSAAVLIGLLAGLAAFIEFVSSCLRARANVASIASFGAALLACIVVGWRCYPYWAAGVYQVQIGAFPQTDLDPKGLVPMIWIGELWRLPVLLLEIPCWLAAALLAVFGVVAVYRRQTLCGSITLLSVGVALACVLLFSPGYGAWLLD